MKGRKHTIVIKRETSDNKENVSINRIIVTNMDDKDPPIEEETILPLLKEGVQSTIDKLKEVNVGIDNGRCLIYLNVNLTLEKEEAYIKLL